MGKHCKPAAFDSWTIDDPIDDPIDNPFGIP